MYTKGLPMWPSTMYVMGPTLVNLVLQCHHAICFLVNLNASWLRSAHAQSGHQQ